MHDSLLSPVLNSETVALADFASRYFFPMTGIKCEREAGSTIADALGAAVRAYYFPSRYRGAEERQGDSREKQIAVQ
jgi:hypothetical protein